MGNSHPSYYSKEKLEDLRVRGVNIPDLSSVKIGIEIPLGNIASGATIYPFTRIYGAKTFIDSGAQIGIFGPVILKDSWIGEKVILGSLGPVTLKNVVVGEGSILGSGVAEDAVFLGKESFVNEFTTGYGFRIRKGSLYEEDASSAQHTDTKMTILFPWATLGSNINFCDVILTGGIGPELGYFSEIGSGTIHFNYTIRGDKATASLFGDVSRGVFLDKERLFIGGNNSLMGPIQADFGAMTAADARIKGFIHAGLNFGESLPNGLKRYEPQFFSSVLSTVSKQVYVISELVSLFNWYKQIRISYIAQTHQKKFVYKSGLKIVELNFKERLSQLKKYMERVQNSHSKIDKLSKLPKKEIIEQKELLKKWLIIEKKLSKLTNFEIPAPESLSASIREQQSEGVSKYTVIIKNLSHEAKLSGASWMSGVSKKVMDVLSME